MIKAAVLGSPIQHSLSPVIHKKAYEILGIEGVYERIDIGVDQFDEFIQSTLNEPWTGFSMTMPLKESAFRHDFDIDARALKIASANTLIRSGSSYRALSTDVMAFDRFFSQLDFSQVLLIGGGGTARAALGALDGLVEMITIVQRSDVRNSQLIPCIDSSKLQFVDFSHQLRGYDLVISTTPQGVSDIFAERVSTDVKNLIEVLYKPSPTKLSEAWKKNGGIVIDGLDLLVEQALDQIHLMTGVSFDYASMRAALIEEVRTQQSHS
jgi:shikimate dehydrogenase